MMRRGFQSYLLPLLAVLLLVGLSASAGEKRVKFPAVEILQSLIDFEESEPSSDPEQRPLVTGRGVEWEATAMPDSTHSWLLMNVAPETLEQISENKDENGQPLL